MDHFLDSVNSSDKRSEGNPGLPAAKEFDRANPEAEWDAGDMGCGELVLELYLRLKSMKPGQLLKLTAQDPGAPEDLPAWCRLTGHRLVSSEHPVYWIQRKET